MPRARGRGPVRGGCGAGKWRSVFGGIRESVVESVESVSVESAISKTKIKKDPTGNSVQGHFDSVNPESVS
jgi:hypothetical protein